MADKTNTDRLQAYTKNGRAHTIITEPGYEIYFFSRMNENSAVNPFSEIFNSKISDFEDVKPFADYVLSSANSTSLGLNRNDTPIVSDIMVRQSISEDQGSIAEVKIINPENVEFFRRTIGNEEPNSQLPDYDWHGKSDTRAIRIGTLDTVIIKLINSSTDFQGITTKKETVFRGIVGDIARTKTAANGSKMVLRLFDFSEFLRNFNALPLGAFSTIVFGITGRDLVNDLLRYSNQLVTGNWNFLSKDPGATASLDGYGAGGAAPDPNSPPDPNNPQTKENTDNQITLQQIGSGITSDLKSFVDFGTLKEVSTGSLSVGTENKNTFHAMRVPPFFWLEYTETQFTKGNSGYIPDNVYGTTFNIKTSFNDAFKTAISDTKKALVDLLSTGALATANKALNGLLTPEDNFTVKTYNAFPLASQTPNIPKKGGASENFQGLTNLFSQQNIWIATDLYLEKSLVTIEHQQIWKTIWDLAQRSMREVYFDFAPKIKKDAQVLFETENLVDALTAGLDIHTAHDIHPNVGILKYRLSPCFIPFKDEISKNVNGDKFETFWQHRFYDVHEDQLISTESRETEEGVFTAVFGFPQSLNKATVQDDVIKIAAGQNRGFITVQSLDPRIEERLGYRFMTDHDQKIRQGPLMYLTSYVLLHKSQMQMFAEQIVITGNPYVQAGSIVRLFDRNIDYYCHQVTHNWSLGEGYLTTLEMNYGHLTGQAPQSLVGNVIEGSLNADTSKDSKDSLCRLKATSLETFVSGDKTIGAIKVQCLVSALWEFMTNSAQSDAELQNASSRQKLNVKPSGSEWINSYQWSENSPITFHTPSNVPDAALRATYLDGPSNANLTIASLRSILHEAIQQTGLDKYQVTENLMLNIVRRESANFIYNIVAQDKGYGLFQLTFNIGPTTTTTQISPNDACFNFQLAAVRACQILAGFMQQYNPKKQGGTDFLDALTCYNRGNNASFRDNTKYAYDVLGADQAEAIAGNRQSPSGVVTQESIWPFNVYGPIGMQTSENGKQKSSADIIGFKGNDADYIKELNTFGTKESGGMSDSVKYLTSLLNKYQKSDTQFAPYNGNEAFAKAITQQDIFEKVVAAWYTNDGNAPLNKINLGTMRSVIQSVRHHYDECINCTASTSSYNPASDKELSTVLNGLKFIPPLSGGVITSPYGPRTPPSLGNGSTGSAFHPGVDIGRSDANGAQIVASESGTVVDTFYDASGGYFVLIDHGNGVLTQTLDLQSVTVQKNTKVKKGQQIGTLGLVNGQVPSFETGLHVHWEIRTGANYPSSKGATRDPIAILKAQGNGIA